MSEVYIVVAGGLGNQLFQAALGVAIKDRFGADVRFLIDYFQSDPYARRLLLHRFTALKFETATLAEAAGAGLAREPGLAPEALGGLISTYPKLAFEGYWQAEHWFLEREAAVRAAFRLEPSAEVGQAAEGLRSRSTIGLHVRRADYGHHGHAAVDYYLQAIAAVRAEVGPTPVACFTDEPNFCRFVFQNVPDLTVLSSDLSDPVDDFQLLSSCAHFIIANSSFSWWAAWLGRAPDSIVYAPAPWCVFQPAFDPIPPGWRRVGGAVRAP